MLTEDERRLMIATICLHGFELYERFTNSGVWLPVLKGQYVDGFFRCVPQWLNGDVPSERRHMDCVGWQRLHWFELTDQLLTDFHRTVTTTC